MSVRPGLIVLAAALLFGAGWAVRGWLADEDLAELRAEHATAIAKAERAARAEEAARTQRVQEIANADRARLAARLRAAESARAAADSLRDAAIAAASAPASDPAAADRGETAAGPGLVLADVLGRCGGRVAALAAAVDAARAAGLVCARAYDSLTDPTTRKDASWQ